MNSYETLSEYYDRFTDDVGYEEWADFFERLFEREGVKPVAGARSGVRNRQSDAHSGAARL